ncbi:GW domain-containing glycosaminoglycan-binding protein [Sporolactobacillus sp. STCC-11]|uniref:GW domain-containing glycosaminoglycan-binding protein n=1 Tax=Sporolactobacillus caesalpiniae TaxID=3230362 RepID=UPI0033940E4F
MIRKTVMSLKALVTTLFGCVLFLIMSTYTQAADNQYSHIINQNEVHYMAQITSEDENQVWSEPYFIEGCDWVASAKSFNGQWVKIIQQAQTDKGTYFLFQTNDKTIGWLDKTAFQSLTDDTYYDKEVNYVGQVKSVSENQIWTQPFQIRGSSWAGSQQTYANQWVQIVREAKTIRGIYYLFQVNGRDIGWMDKTAFQSIGDDTYDDQEVHYTGQVKTGGTDQVWEKPFPVSGSKWLASQSSYAGQWVKIIRQAKTVAGTYYQYQINGQTIGWMDTNAFQSLADDTYYDNDVNYVGQVKSGSENQIWTQPFQIRGSSWAGSQQTYANQWVQIVREAKTIRGTYYLFQVNGRNIGWMDITAFQSIDDDKYEDQEIHYTGQVKTGGANQVWEKPFPVSGSKWLASQSSYAGQWVKIIRQAKTVAGTYYQYQIDGQAVGWMDTNAFQSLADDTYYDNEVNYVGQVKSGSDNQIWSQPFPIRGSSWAGSQQTYANQWVQIVREAKTIRGIYYLFQVDGRNIGWLDKTAFQSIGNNSYTDKTVDYIAQIISGNENQIWSQPFPVNRSSWVDSAGSYKSDWVKVIREAQTYKGTYCLIQLNGRTIGWIDKNALLATNAYNVGIDISHHQNDKGTIDFNAVKNQGINFVSIKATEGTTYKDPYFEENINSARNAGLKTNAYHFFHATDNDSDAIHEADFFASQLKNVNFDGYAFIDVEINGSVGMGNVTNRIALFLQELKNQGINKIGIYSSKNYFNNYIDLSTLKNKYSGLIIWVAAYHDINLGPQFTTDLWQYSSSENVSGITGPVDMDLTFNTQF